MKFNLNELKSNSNDQCEKNKDNCNNQLIGPIISKDLIDEGNIIFFISLLKKIAFSLTDYSYKVTNATKFNGHLFALFPYTVTDKEKLSSLSDNNIIYNIKHFHNIGSELNEVKILPGMHYHNIPIQNAIILKYINGDSCIDDGSRNISAYIIINCDSTGGVYLSPQLKFISNDKCTFVFEWNNRFGCPNCLKQDLVPIVEGCFDGNKRAHYFENLNCVIPKEDIASDTKSVEYNSENNILHYDNLDEILSNYLLMRYDLTDYQLKQDFSISNITLNASLINKSNDEVYVENRIQQIPCSKLGDSFLISSYSERVIISAIAIAYAILILCLVYLFCQYKRVSKEYTRLKQNDTSNSNDTYPNTEIELTNI